MIKVLYGLLLTGVVVFLLFVFLPSFTPNQNDVSSKSILSAARGPNLSSSAVIDSLKAFAQIAQEGDQLLLAQKALDAALILDSTDSDLYGLLGIVHLQKKEFELALTTWQLGKRYAPENPNLEYLSSLSVDDLKNLTVVDLEKFFAFSAARQAALADTILWRKQPIVKSLQTMWKSKSALTYGLYLIIVLFLITFLVRKSKSRSQSHEEAKPTGGDPQPILGSAMWVALIVKLLYTLLGAYTAVDTSFKLSGFLKQYVFVPENLTQLVQTDKIFVIVLGLVILSKIGVFKQLVGKKT